MKKKIKDLTLEEMKYDKYMDKECIALCDELNSLKGVKTFESCCGHCKMPYFIYMKISNWYSLSLLARAFDARYGGILWKIELSSMDIPTKKIGVSCFTLCSREPFETQKEMEDAIKKAIERINYWKQRRFKKHLNGTEKLKRYQRKH